jgi:hypothetical protein
MPHAGGGTIGSVVRVPEGLSTHRGPRAANQVLKPQATRRAMSSWAGTTGCRATPFSV